MGLINRVVLSFSFFFVGVLLLQSANAKVVAYEPQIPQHNLNCDAIFSCPIEIDRRVDFWISVFRQWNKQNRILHDANKPERVYTVLDTESECSRKRPKGEVKRETANVNKRLNGLIKLIESGASEAEIRAHRYAKLFPSLNLQEIKNAKKSIRCQTGNKEMFTKALTEFQRYQPYVQKALKAQNLPLDIQYLPFVESSYNPKAYSYAGAAGMWQIMPRTARSLGLQLGGSIDERFEPEFATIAAAKYFRNSIDKLTETAREQGASTRPKDINPFVITSYNYGVRGMQRAIQKVGTDYTRLLNEYKSRSFQTAVKNFYASFLAARYVAQNQANYFSNIDKPRISTIQRVALPKPMLVKYIQKATGVSKEQLRSLNPAMTYRVWRNQAAVPTGFVVKLPENVNINTAQANLKKMPAHKAGGGDSGIRHKVRRGETACKIAERYKVKCRDLIALNNLGRKAVIRINQRLKIPGGVQKYRLTNIVKDSITLRQALSVGPSSTNIIAEADTNVTIQNANQASQLPQGLVIAEPSVKQEVDRSNEKPVVKATNESVDNKVNPQPQERIVNLDTTVYSRNNKHWLIVLPTESLALYSDWLGTGSTREMRRLNKLKGKAAVDVNQRVYLPIKSNEQKRQFLLARDEYHLSLQLQYFERFKLTNVKERRLRNGETLWSLARNNNIPLWLVMQFNKNPQAGSIIKIPLVTSK
jgi:membrane-bound lytic murein transglycosylase D